MPIQKGLTYAIIPARSGSTSIKDKNIHLIGKHPLMAYSIAAAKVCKNINRVIVSTDSERYAEVANRYGAETPFLRPAEISGKYSTDIEFMQHAINWFGDNEKVLPEFWVHLRPTSPLRNSELIDDAIDKFRSSDADCLRSVHLCRECPYKWFNMSEDGHLKTLCGISFDEANGPRQNYPPVYIPNGYVDVLRTEQILRTGTMYGSSAISFETSEMIDIDYSSELEEVQRLIVDFTGPVGEYLKRYE